MTEAATLVPDANGMLPNGLHQPTLNVVLVAAYEIARNEKKALMGALEEQDITGLLQDVSTVSTLLSFAGVVKNLPNHAPALVADAIENAPAVLEKARQEEETGKALKEKVEAMLMAAHAKQNPLDVN